MVASPKDAQENLAPAIEQAEWETWALKQVAAGRSFFEVSKERRTYKSKTGR